MSEHGGEMAAPVEKQESKVIQRVAERVGKFLSETYTVKGAKEKELRKMDRVISSFTPSQQGEMRAYFAAKAEKNAKWKVIRNWVATGAGIALGGWVAAVGPEKAALAVIGAAGEVSKWWTATAVPALQDIGAAIAAPFAKAKVTVSNYLSYMFDVSRPVTNVDITKTIGLDAIPPPPKIHLTIPKINWKW